MTSLVYDAWMLAVLAASQGKGGGGVPAYKQWKARDLGRGAILTGQADRDRLAGWDFTGTKFHSKE